MELHDAIKYILYYRGQSQTWLAEQMGYKSNRALWNTLKRGNVELNTLIRMCECVGAKIVIWFPDDKRPGRIVELKRREP